MKRFALAIILMATACAARTHKRITPLGNTQHSVTLNWQSNNPANTTFNIYQDQPTGPPGWTKIATGVVGLAYTDYTVKSNKQYCYEVTAALGNQESDPSNQTCVTVPK